MTRTDTQWGAGRKRGLRRIIVALDSEQLLFVREEAARRMVERNIGRADMGEVIRDSLEKVRSEGLGKPKTVVTVLDATSNARNVGCKFGSGMDRVVVSAGVLSIVDHPDREKADRMLGMLLRIVLEGPKTKRERIAEGIEKVHVLTSRSGVEIVANKRFVVVEIEATLLVMTLWEFELNYTAVDVGELEIQVLEPRPRSSAPKA